MTPPVAKLPLLATVAGFRRFSVPEYHRLTEIGILTEDDNVELIEGYIVQKMTRNPSHDGTLHSLLEQLVRLLPAGWKVRIQSGITLSDSEPEPDLALVREDPAGYMTRHPSAADVGLVIEVSDSSLAADRADKGRIYARASIGSYWIVNLPDRQIEVYTNPSGPVGVPAYGQRQDFAANTVVPLLLDGQPIGNVPVQSVLP
jgi:hypothetical protein